MPRSELEGRFEAIIAAITAGDLTALDPLIRYDITDHSFILGQSGGLRGIKYWAKTLRSAMPDLTATVQDTVSGTDKIAARVRWAGTHTGDLPGAPATYSYLEFESFYILHFSDGMAVDWWDGSDTREALRSLSRRARLLEAKSIINRSSPRPYHQRSPRPPQGARRRPLSRV